MSNLSYQTDEVFIHYPELLPYFYDGKKVEPDDPLYGRVVDVSELLLDYYDTLLDMKYIARDVESNKGWISWVEGSFVTSPVLVHTLRDNKDWYPGLYDFYKEWESKHNTTTLK
jgi:hypothetical protein